MLAIGVRVEVPQAWEEKGEFQGLAAVAVDQMAEVEAEAMEVVA